MGMAPFLHAGFILKLGKVAGISAASIFAYDVVHVLNNESSSESGEKKVLEKAWDRFSDLKTPKEIRLATKDVVTFENGEKVVSVTFDAIMDYQKKIRAIFRSKPKGD